MTTPTIPTLSFADWTTDDATTRQRFIHALGHALEDLGFVALTDHGIPHDLLAQGYETAQQVFALPRQTKLQYADPANQHQRGYTPFATEHAKDHAVPDLKEFWQIGRDLPKDHPLRLDGRLVANRFPDEVPAFATTFRQLFTALEHFALSLLDAIGEFLERPDGDFRAMVRDGDSVLRIINYPDMGHTLPKGAVRAAQHEDINLLTVLPASTQPGLELLTRDNTWLAVQTPPNVMICDTGDMMHLITGGRLPATTHRVVNPEATDGGRMSMPFFMHPHPDALLTPPADDPRSPIRAREFLLNRLRDIGVA